MSIPHDNHLQHALLLLLSKAPDGTMHCNDVYVELAKLFPELTDEEMNVRYRESKSKWANRVQFARLHCVQSGYIFDAQSGIKGTGYWSITNKGRHYIEYDYGKIYIEKELSHLAKIDSILIENEKMEEVKKEIEELVFIEEDRYASIEPFDPKDIQDGRVRSIASIVHRRGQPKFRQELLKIYGGKCAITGENVEQALEASHIIPYKGEQTNHPSNGLLLRADIHILFDLRLLTIDTTNMTVILSLELMGTSYQRYKGVKLHLPSNVNKRPNTEALDTHRRECGL